LGREDASQHCGDHARELFSGQGHRIALPDLRGDRPPGEKRGEGEGVHGVRGTFSLVPHPRRPNHLGGNPPDPHSAEEDPMKFGAPSFLYALALIPPLIAFLIWGWRQREKALERFIEAGLGKRLATEVSPARRKWKNVLLVFITTLALFSLARP